MLDPLNVCIQKYPASWWHLAVSRYSLDVSWSLTNSSRSYLSGNTACINSTDSPFRNETKMTTWLHIGRLKCSRKTLFMVVTYKLENGRNKYTRSLESSSLKRRSTLTWLYGATSHKTLNFILAAVRTWNLTWNLFVYGYPQIMNMKMNVLATVWKWLWLQRIGVLSIWQDIVSH
jgi:hypothetical protein